MRTITATVLTLTALTPSTLAWGTLGHTTIAYIASNFLSPATQQWAARTLNTTSTNEDYLANIANWADFYRHTPSGAFTSRYHYIDARDNPPGNCNVECARDCLEGCIVSAFANYTARVSDCGLEAIEREQALKFLVHFAGDVAQPLHAEGVARGGNEVGVLWQRVERDLHGVWDEEIVGKLRGVGTGGGELGEAKQWADELTGEIEWGIFRWQREGWLCGVDYGDVVGTVLGWARDSNELVCSHVIPEGVGAVEGKELSGEYYGSVVDVVELQIARAGYRLAAWLDAIARSQQKGWYYLQFPGFEGWRKADRHRC